jgi:hypothetical protein
MESIEVLNKPQEDMTLEKALKTIKQINDRHELQLKLTEAARRERPTEA